MFMREDLYIKIIKFFLIVMCYCRQVYYYCSYKQRNMANEIISEFFLFYGLDLMNIDYL